MDGSELEIISKSRGIANGVQNSYADALKGMPQCASKPAPSIGCQYPVYAEGMGPEDADGADTTVDVGGPKRLHD
jgi:hypothetical protein